MAKVKAEGTDAEMWRRQKEAAEEDKRIQEILRGEEVRGLQKEADRLSE